MRGAIGLVVVHLVEFRQSGDAGGRGKEGRSRVGVVGFAKIIGEEDVVATKNLVRALT